YLVKEVEMIMHSAVLLKAEVKALQAANEQKKRRERKQVASEGSQAADLGKAKESAHSLKVLFDLVLAINSLSPNTEYWTSHNRFIHGLGIVAAKDLNGRNAGTDPMGVV
ncbi:hypothetical protein V496_01312, partial [Pseudogymnoascus sp. VKM F-4515 (FW-2607)]